METKIFITQHLVADLISAAIKTLPRKAYGIIGGKDKFHPTSMYQCFTNLRNTPEWSDFFDSFGEFYKNPDRGFVISSEEVFEVHRKMDEKDEEMVGVFHTHRCCVPAEPTTLDRKTHVMCQGIETLAYLISVIEPNKPELRAYEIIDEETHKEVSFEIEGRCYG